MLPETLVADFTFSEFVNPMVALENVLVAHVASEPTAGFYVAEAGLQGGRRLFQGVSYVVHICRCCGERSRSS